MVVRAIRTQLVTLLFAVQFAVDQRSGGMHSREIADWMVTAVADYFRDNGETTVHFCQMEELKYYFRASCHVD